MIIVYLGRNCDGSLFQATGRDAPVAGLAVINSRCDCGEPLFAVMHVRSGTALFFVHDDQARIPGKAWKALRGIDWTRPASELEKDPSAANARDYAITLVPYSCRHAAVMSAPMGVTA